MKEFLRRLSHKEKLTPEPQTFFTYYNGVTRQQLRESNYPDNYLTGYTVYADDENGQEYSLRLEKEGRWGSRETIHPQVALSLFSLDEVQPDETTLLKFVTAAMKMRDALSSKGAVDWKLEAESGDLQLDATFDIYPDEQLPQKAFSTKEAVASFVDADLPAHGFTPHRGGIAYFSGMSMEQLQACNFSKSTWQNEVSNSKTLASVKLQK